MIDNLQESSPVTLYDLFSNSLVACTIFPYLPPHGVLSLAATNKAYKALIKHTPGVFRHLDLTSVKRARIGGSQNEFHGNSWRPASDDVDDTIGEPFIWRNVLSDEDQTEDE